MLHGLPLDDNQIAENEDDRTTDKFRFPHVYALLRAAGHDPTKAAEVLIDAQRKDVDARVWVKTLAASRRRVLR